MKVKFFWLIFACIVFFVVGWVAGGHQVGLVSIGGKNTPSQISSSLTFNLPQVPLP